MTAATDGALLQAVLDCGGQQLTETLTAAEAHMLAIAGEYGEQLAGPARATISAGGKRLRPLLVCLAAGVPPTQTDRLVAAAVAVELVHAASLVHDDVLDRSDLRRGAPTVFASGGRLLATATGDLLFSRAFAELAAARDIDAVRILAGAANDLAAGELLQRADAFDPEVSEQRYMKRCALKTGALFRAAGELGQINGSAGQRAGAQDLSRFGELVGVAFQMLDDILDVTGPPERTGKPRGADLLDGTVTLPLIEARRRGLEVSRAALEAIDGPEAAERWCETITATGALVPVRERALAVVAEAKSLLGGLPEPQARALGLVADAVVERYR